MNNLYQKNLLSIDNLSKEDINTVFKKTDEMKALVEKDGADDRLKGKILAALFFEASSRTFTSFITAMQRLGGGFIPFNGMANTSIAKGETLKDTANVFSTYADIIVFRHPQVGSAQKVAEASQVPVINAGDGPGEHPTQALLDCYTISKHFNFFSSLTVGLVGDLLYGRTVHSLSKAFLKLGVKKFIFVSPDILRMPKKIGQRIKDKGGELIESCTLKDTISKMDVIYDTRVQKERFSDLALYEKLKHSFIIDAKLLKRAKKRAVLMHPLPRVGEIAEEVDKDRRALYFSEQIKNGLYVRMALLDLILRK